MPTKIHAMAAAITGEARAAVGAGYSSILALTAALPPACLIAGPT